MIHFPSSRYNEIRDNILLTRCLAAYLDKGGDCTKIILATGSGSGLRNIRVEVNTKIWRN